MKIVVDAEKCTGMGICESVAPDVFEVDDDGMVHVLLDEPEPERRGEIERAVEGCPAFALRLVG